MHKIRFAAVLLVSGGLVASGACGKDLETAKREYVRLGDENVTRAKYKEAAIHYRNALQQDPQFGEARLKLAETYERLGDVKNALAEYVRAADLLADNADVQVKAANVLLLARRFEDAKARADRALALAPNSVEAQVAKGNALAGLKNLDAAAAELEGAVHADPASVPARLALANFYWNLGRLPAAERELQAALAVDPQDVSANRMRSIFSLATNRASDAEPYLKTIVEVSKRNSDRFVLADYYFSAGRSAEAKAVLQELAKTDAADAQVFSGARIRLAAIEARGGDTPAARLLIDEVLQRQPSNVDALVASADLVLVGKKHNQALAAAVAAVQADPRSVSAQHALAKVHSARQYWDDAIVAYLGVLRLDPRVNAARLELARLSLLKGKPDDAMQFAREVLKAQPGLAEATMILARAMLMKGDSAGAEPHVKQLATEFPKSASAQTELGQLYAQTGNIKSARGAFERALAIDPTNLEALSGITALDLKAKDPAGARARVEARLAASGNDPRLLLLAARLYLVLGDVTATERSLRKVIEVDPAHLDAYALLGQFYASNRRLDEARAEFEKIAQLRPKSAVAAQTVVGVILQMQNKQAEAQARYEMVLALDPKAAVAANNLAWIYAERGGNLDVALGLAQTAKSQLANDPQVANTLGWVYYKKGLPGLAVPILRESVDKVPNNARYHYHLGLAYAKIGNNEEARKALEQALRLDPTFDGSADARRVLAGLKG